MARQGDQHRIDIVTGQKLAEVAIGRTRPVVAPAKLVGIELVHAGTTLFAALTSDVADGQHLCVVAGNVATADIGPRPPQQMPTSLAAHTDVAHTDPLAGRRVSGKTQRR